MTSNLRRWSHFKSTLEICFSESASVYYHFRKIKEGTRKMAQIAWKELSVRTVHTLPSYKFSEIKVREILRNAKLQSFFPLEIRRQSSKHPLFAQCLLRRTVTSTRSVIPFMMAQETCSCLPCVPVPQFHTPRPGDQCFQDTFKNNSMFYKMVSGICRCFLC